MQDPKHCDHSTLVANHDKGGALTCQGCGFVVSKDGGAMWHPDSAGGDFSTTADVQNWVIPKGAAPRPAPTIIV